MENVGRIRQTNGTLCSLTRRSLHVSNPIKTIRAPVIWRRDYSFEHARVFNQARKQLAGSGGFILFRYHQELYAFRSQESEEALLIFGNAIKKRMIEVVSGDARNDPHFGAVAENPDRRIGGIFLFENVRDCLRTLFLRHKSGEIFDLRLELNDADEQRDPKSRPRQNGTLFEDLLHRVREHRQTEREQYQAVARPDVGIVLRQIGKRDETEVRKKEQFADQRVSDL